MADASKSNFNFNFPSTSTELSQAQAKIKYCGYLKKKRNKMGGWSKMWFVLQDKLLVSYNSKEEYDNKLVSFKDVLNLVPGTIVRPLGGFRFTIETTSQTMYTFHCDDRVAYRKWITMLLYSLDTDNMPTIRQHEQNKPFILVKQFSNISLDSYRLDTKFSENYKFVDKKLTAVIETKINQSTTTGSAFLPIGNKTAKILELNGADGLQDFGCKTNERRTERHHCEPQFRLHNIMYDRSLSATELRSLKHFTLLQIPEKANTVNLINRMFYTEDHNKLILKKSDETTAKGVEATTTIPARKYDSGDNAAAAAVCSRECNSVPADESKTLDMIKDKIHHISVKGSKNSTVDIMPCSMEKYSQKKLTANATIEEVIIKKDTEPIKTVADITNCGDMIPESNQAEPVYAIVDFKSKYANRKVRHSNLESNQRCNSYDSIIQQTYDQFPIQRQTKLKYESCKSQKPCDSPIYRDTRTDKETDHNDIEGIYEDSDVFAKDDLTKLNIERDCDENIYEPINISSARNSTIWAYFNRLKINSILQITRIKKNNTEYGKYEYSKPTKLNSQSGSQIFDFKNKNSSNRKSIKVRMRKFCFKEYEPKPFFKHNQQQKMCNNNQIPITPIKKLKNRWKSVKLASRNQNVLSETGTKAGKRCFFGSLPHLRKSRNSLFSNQQHPFHKNGNAKTVKNLEDIETVDTKT